MTVADMFIKLPTIWSIGDEEKEKQADLLGTDYIPELTEDFIFINPQLITRYNKSSRPNECTVGLSDGDAYRILLPLEEFEKHLDRYYNRILRIEAFDRLMEEQKNIHPYK